LLHTAPARKRSSIFSEGAIRAASASGEVAAHRSSQETFIDLL
jgi:hypothetical protein